MIPMHHARLATTLDFIYCCYYYYCSGRKFYKKTRYLLSRSIKTRTRKN